MALPNDMYWSMNVGARWIIDMGINVLLFEQGCQNPYPCADKCDVANLTCLALWFHGHSQAGPRAPVSMWLYIGYCSINPILTFIITIVSIVLKVAAMFTARLGTGRF